MVLAVVLFCRLRVIVEKEQLLRELRSAGSATQAEVVKCRIRQLEHDLHQHAIDYNPQSFDTDKCVVSSLCDVY